MGCTVTNYGVKAISMAQEIEMLLRVSGDTERAYGEIIESEQKERAAVNR